ncbi:MAG: VOC family protein [Pseudomonadales bacterium]
MIASLGYVRIQMAEPEQWRQVGEDILGFDADGSGKSVRLRMDEAPFRYLVEQGEEERFICAGWECPAAKYDALSDKLRAAGLEVQQGSAEECQQRQVAGFIEAKDPSGNSFEVFHTRASGKPFASTIKGVEFLTGAMGMGHVVLPASAHDDTCRFYQDLLGFGLSDDLTLPPPAEGAPEMRVYFLHADNPRHHSLGLFNGPSPSGVIHLMVELTSLDAVGACLDRVLAAGLPITATLGRHSNDGMVSFYFLAPAGVPIEVGFDGKQFDWQKFTPTKSTDGDIWGHDYNFPPP